jgi:hypothetical protein
VVNPIARAVVATGRYVAVLPAGCVITRAGDVSLYQCGSTFYRLGSGGYEVVTIR